MSILFMDNYVLYVYNEVVFGHLLPIKKVYMKKVSFFIIFFSQFVLIEAYGMSQDDFLKKYSCPSIRSFPLRFTDRCNMVENDFDRLSSRERLNIVHNYFKNYKLADEQYISDVKVKQILTVASVGYCISSFVVGGFLFLIGTIGDSGGSPGLNEKLLFGGVFIMVQSVVIPFGGLIYRISKTIDAIHSTDLEKMKAVHEILMSLPINENGKQAE